MKNFQLHHPRTLEEATKLLADPHSLAMAGGQDLLGELKEYLAAPDRVIDLKHLPGLKAIAFDGKTLRLGALCTLTEVAGHADVQQHFPALAEAARSVGTVQIRNLGTVGGNLCQRPRCWYYRDEQMVCLKKGGYTCFAADERGENKYNAILGGGPSYIVHPSDLAPALVALDASLTVVGPDAKAHQVSAGNFFTLPSQGPLTRENVLKPGEIVTAVTIPASALASHSTYLKFRERESFDFALAAVAMAAVLRDGKVSQARIVLGGVAPIPWHAPGAEQALQGRSPKDEAALTAAAKAATHGARPLSQNAYKVALVQGLVKQAARHLGGSHP